MAKSNGNGSSGGLATFEEHETGLAAETTSPSSIGVAAEQARAQAEAQAALAVAAARPRNYVRALDRIQLGCERPVLAQEAEYVYPRGGTDVTGPTIHLLTHIANCWGNIQFGFRELSQANGSSTVEAFAWDLETNSRRTVVFHVPHKRDTRRGTQALTDARDVYELVANQAQRRVRACLEAIIPVDVVEQARQWCNETLNEEAEVTPDSKKNLVAAFREFGVTVAQIETRIQRRLDSMVPAQLVGLRKIYKSLKDGMSKPDQWFESSEAAPAPEAANQSTKDKLRKQRSATEPAPIEEPRAADEKPSPKPPGDIRAATKELMACRDANSIRSTQKRLIEGYEWSENDQRQIDATAEEMLAG